MASKNINVNLWANVSGFMRGMQSAQKSYAKFISALQVAAPVLAVAKLAAMFDETAKNIDDLADNAAKIGISAQSFEALNFAADRFNVSQQAMTSGMQKMLVNLEKSSKEFEAIGLNVAELKKLAPDEMFGRVAAAIGEMNSLSGQANAAKSIFGRGGVELLGAIRSGELDEVIAKGRELNAALADPVALAAANDYANAMQEIAAAWENMKRAAAGGIAKALFVQMGASAPTLTESLADFEAKLSKLQEERNYRIRSQGNSITGNPGITGVNNQIAATRKAIAVLKQRIGIEEFQAEFEAQLGAGGGGNRTPITNMWNAGKMAFQDFKFSVVSGFDQIAYAAELAQHEIEMGWKRQKEALEDQADSIRDQLKDIEEDRIFSIADAMRSTGAPSAAMRGSSEAANNIANAMASARGDQEADKYLRDIGKATSSTAQRVLELKMKLNDLVSAIEKIPIAKP